MKRKTYPRPWEVVSRHRTGEVRLSTDAYKNMTHPYAALLWRETERREVRAGEFEWRETVKAGRPVYAHENPTVWRTLAIWRVLEREFLAQFPDETVRPKLAADEAETPPESRRRGAKP